MVGVSSTWVWGGGGGGGGGLIGFCLKGAMFSSNVLTFCSVPVVPLSVSTVAHASCLVVTRKNQNMAKLVVVVGGGGELTEMK